MKKINFKILLLSLGMLCSINSATMVFADDSKSAMTVSPMSQKMILAPGETTTGSVDVSNPMSASSDLTYSVHIGSFSQKRSDDDLDDYGAVDTDIVSNYNMMMDWITLDKTEGTVAPNETDTIKFTINVPKDAPAGGQYATILIKDDTEKSDNANGNVAIQSVTQVASIIYAEVAGETREDGQIVKNDLPGFVFSNQLDATSIVRNNGNVHTNAKYVLQVWPMGSDEEICTNEEEAAESLVMPETEKYHAETCALPLVGIFRAKQTVKIFSETSIVEKVIIKCPVWLLFIILFAIIALIIWIFLKVSKRRGAKRER